MNYMILLLASVLPIHAAVTFSGVSDFAFVPDASSLKFTNSISFSFSAMKRGNTTPNSYFIFGKGTSAYSYSADFATVGSTYGCEFQWNDPSLFAQAYGEPVTPASITNQWSTVGFNHNWGSDNTIYFNRGTLPTMTCFAGNCARISLDLAEPLEIAKGRGGFAKWAGPIGEISIWNTNLTSRQLQILSGCKIKGMAKQIRSTNLVIHLSMDSFVSGTSIADGTLLKDTSGNGNHAICTNSPVASPENVSSYLPNE